VITWTVGKEPGGFRQLQTTRGTGKTGDGVYANTQLILALLPVLDDFEGLLTRYP